MSKLAQAGKWLGTVESTIVSKRGGAHSANEVALLVVVYKVVATTVGAELAVLLHKARRGHVARSRWRSASRAA